MVRNNNSRFFIPYYIYNQIHYPDYPNGPLIAFSKKAVKLISEFDYNRIINIWMDDVIIGMVINVFLPNISFIKHNLIYIHSLPPGAIYFLHSSI